MVRAYPRLIERFPAYRDEVLKRRFSDTVINELCTDYDRVVGILDGDSSGTYEQLSRQERQELQALATKLEHEFLVRLAQWPTNDANH